MIDPVETHGRASLKLATTRLAFIIWGVSASLKLAITHRAFIIWGRFTIQQ